MNEEQTIASSYTSELERLAYQIGGVEAAIQAAIRSNDDQEWLEYLQNRHVELKQQLELCQQQQKTQRNK